jgi:hypothetical protein
MKKSELRKMIKEEISNLNEGKDVFVLKYRREDSRYLSSKQRDVDNVKDALQFKTDKQAKQMKFSMDRQFRSNYDIVKVKV